MNQFTKLIQLKSTWLFVMNPIQWGRFRSRLKERKQFAKYFIETDVILSYQAEHYIPNHIRKYIINFGFHISHRFKNQRFINGRLIT